MRECEEAWPSSVAARATSSRGPTTVTRSPGSSVSDIWGRVIGPVSPRRRREKETFSPSFS